MDLTANLPPQLLGKLDKNLLQYMPAGVDFPVGGTKASPKPAIDKLFKGLVSKAGEKAVLDRVRGGGKDNGGASAAPTTQGSEKDNPVGDILGDLINKKKKD